MTAELPEILYRGVASLSPHHLEAQNKGTCTPRGRDSGGGFPYHHSRGRTESSNKTSWTATRSVALGYARSSPNALGVILEIDFREKVAIANEYNQMGDMFGEDEYLITGKIRGVRVKPAK